MTASHLELLVEEPSMEAFLRALLPAAAAPDRSFEIHAFQGKQDLLGKLEARLRGYAAWLPAHGALWSSWTATTMTALSSKRQSEDCGPARWLAHAHPRRDAPWQFVNRIAIKELESGYSNREGGGPEDRWPLVAGLAFLAVGTLTNRSKSGSRS